jgi:hypothetical protein
MNESSSFIVTRNTYAYLHDILRRLPSHPNKDIRQLTPRGWKETFAPKSPPPGPSG